MIRNILLLLLLLGSCLAQYKHIPLPWVYSYVRVTGNYELYYAKGILPGREILPHVYSPLTRDVFAYTLFQLKNYPKKDIDICDDITKEHWLYPYLYSLNKNNIMKPFPDNKFYPQKMVTKGEMAVVLFKALNLPYNHQEKIPFNDVDKEDWHYDAVSSLYNYGLLKDAEVFRPTKIITVREYLHIYQRLLKN